MSSVFRMATMQAIKEIIEENGVSGRFGLIVTEESMDEICARVVDLFEMTLELRAKTSEIFSGGSAQVKQPQTTQQKRAFANSRLGEFNDEGRFPTTKNAAEIYAPQSSNRLTEKQPAMMAGMDLKLPRTRFELSMGEKERLTRR